MSGPWTTVAPMPAARFAPAAAAINGILYVAGGFNGQETPTLQAYDAATNTWTTLANMPAGRYQGDGAAVINGQLYVTGGWATTDHLPHPDLFVYDPGTNTWASRASMPHLSGDGISGAINGKLYVTTPANGFSGYQSLLDVYDPVSDSWSSLAPSPHVHDVPAGGVIGGKFYVVGGFDGSSNSNVLDVYDPATDTWTTKAPVPSGGFQSAAGAVIGGKLYVVGGTDGTNDLATVEVYDPASDAWTTETPMPTARQKLVAGVVNGVLYAAGGVDNNGVVLATNEAFTLAPAKFVVSGFPSPTVAGSVASFTVTAEDAGGNVVSSYTGTVHFTSTDKKAILPANYTFTSTDAGVHSFATLLKTAGMQTITATDTVTKTITGAQSGIAVIPAPASQLKVSAPTSSIAGAAFNITVKALDPYGNIATYYAGTVQFTSSDKKAVLPANYAFTGSDAGIHVFSNGVTLKTAGSQTVTATDTVTATIIGKSTIKVSPAAVNHLKITAPASCTAGTAFSITVTAQDVYNNTVTSYTGTIHFTSTDSHAMLPANYAFTATDKGVHKFSSGATLKTAGTQTVTATDLATATVTGSASIVVKPGKASTLSISAPASVTKGVAFTFTVTALDLFGNVATGYTGTVHFSSSDGAASLPANHKFTSTDAGVDTFSAILNTTGAQSLTASDTVTSSITGTDSAIQVNAGAAAVRQESTSLLSALSATDLADRIARILEKGTDSCPLPS